MKRIMPDSDESFDVVVVGGGPGGSAAAKRCAREGFKTLLLEKRRLPRDKVCTGMIMGPWAHDVIQWEFGALPQGVLVSPQGLSGHMIHVPGAPSRVLEWRTPLAWRKDLDFWMNQRAADEGVEIRDGIRVTGVSQTGNQCFVAFKQEGKEPRRLRTRFVIGADGAASAVRKSLFPGLRVRYSAPVRHCYEGALDLDRQYIHWFFPESRPRPRFDLVHKCDSFLLEGSGIRELRNDLGRILSRYGFEPDSRPRPITAMAASGKKKPLRRSERSVRLILAKK